MYYFFIFIVLISLLVFLFKKRNFDFLSIYYILLFLYNMTTMMGVVRNKYTLNFDEPNLYLYLVTAFPFIFVTIFLLVKQPKTTSYNEMRVSYICNANNKAQLQLYLNILLTVMLVYIATNFDALFLSKTKVELLENRSFFAILVSGFFPMMFMLAFVLKDKKKLLFLSILLLILFLFGARSRLASVVLTMTILVLHGRKIKIIKQRTMIFLGFIGLNTVILGKTLYGYILSRGVKEGISSWLENFDFVTYYRIGSEFLGTSTILNRVIETDFSFSNSDFFLSFVSLLPIPVSIFGLDSGVFNKSFQPILFPGIEYGMAYNIWAEAYSWSGLLGVALIAFLIPFLLYKLWTLYIKNTGTFWGLVIIIVGYTLAFWAHRNSVGTLSASIRNTFYPIVVLWFVSKFLFLIRKKT